MRLFHRDEALASSEKASSANTERIDRSGPLCAGRPRKQGSVDALNRLLTWRAIRANEFRLQIAS
jgi:hypothetical protein